MPCDHRHASWRSQWFGYKTQGVLQKIYALGMRSFSSSKASAFELREEAGGFLPGLPDTWTHLLLYLKGSLGQILVPSVLKVPTLNQLLVCVLSDPPQPPLQSRDD